MWILFALLAALTSAIVVTLSKAAIKNVDSSLAFAIQGVFILVISWAVVTFQGNLPNVGQIERRNWLFLGIAGILTCISSLLAFYALKLGDASRVSPLERLSLVFAIIFAVIFLKERVDWPIILGALLMAGGAIIIAVYSQPSK
ncbi:EamA family transporter [Adhaeribacter pallidiroseus]|uniref:Putative transporter in cobO 3'region n=1 Tax=Adhaeribacter pallidiroseus TaxID=2072847 RepID=A0A369QCG5_9BACT|nr:EamA family transporter [Adhaeribacter pallidiroseus]RDC62132.1 putative transporter in cobO 3'region [Adhaeribacter pallidiroseus]